MCGLRIRESKFRTAYMCNLLAILSLRTVVFCIDTPPTFHRLKHRVQCTRVGVLLKAAPAAPSALATINDT